MSTKAFPSRCVHRLRVMILISLVVLVLPVSALPAGAQQAGDVRVISRFETPEPLIVLTFDAGSDRGYAGEILDILADEGILASFGMTGVWAEQNPDLVVRMHSEGHHLMNHSWDHPHFTQISPAERVDQLRRTDDVVYSLTGVRLAPYFRPPYGEYDDGTLADLAAEGYTTMVMWTVDTLGWNGYSAAQITQRVVDGAASGAIMLMHVGAASQDAAALPAIIDQLRAGGYGFATAADLAGPPPPAERYFPETDQWLAGGFYRYWQQFGGLGVFGYPLTGELQEDGRTVQYFERVRFESHPGSWAERYDVLLGRLGFTLVEQRILAGEAPFQPVANGSEDECDFFPETGHTLCSAFRDYWRAHGGLAILGYPISAEFTEINPDDGQEYTVQYFERARFEWHPGPNGGSVLLGRLGAQVLAAR